MNNKQSDLEEVLQLISGLPREQRLHVFRVLRREFGIHSIEKRLNAEAEIILEAIDRAGALTLRGIRGVIAEAAFATDIIEPLAGWEDVPLAGDPSYDFLIRDRESEVRIQVKLQRQKAHRPMLGSEAPRWAGLPPDYFVVETQRTRGGTSPTGEDTRPYRFGEFDILAVSMQPATGVWSTFLYTVADWLVPHPDNAACIQKYQAVPPAPNEFWSGDLLQAIQWHRSGEKRALPVFRSPSR